MKHAAALLLTAALSIAGAQLAPQSTQAADPSLSPTSITIETGTYQGPLSSLLGAVAKSAGYELVLEVNVDALDKGESGAIPVAYSFKNKPFNEVWPLLMDVYGLNYTVTRLGDQPVIRVNKEAVQQVVNLKTVDADYAVQRAKVFFGTPTDSQGQAPAAGGANAAANQPRYEFTSPTLRAVADPVANRVIVRGGNREVAEVASFMTNLDQAATEQRQQQLEQYGQNAQETREEIYRSNGEAAQIASFIASQYPALNVRQLPNSAGILIRGNGSVVDNALQLLSKIDPAPAVAGVTQKVFVLSNAAAKDVAETLNNTLARQLTAASAKAGSNSDTNSADKGNSSTISEAVKLAEKEATIIADDRTNSLIVRGTAGQVAQIEALIPVLDVRVPQINLQVRIQEINEAARESLGVDWKASAGGFQVALASGGITAAFNPTSTNMGFNILPTLNALESQTFSKRVYDGTVSMQSGQRNLSAGNGSQDASSTAAASIRSGGRLEINIPSATGNIEKVIPYGVILDFFDPVVGPDGTITVRVRGQINTPNNPDALSVATAQGLPPYLLDFANSEAQTKISFKPGETVLLAGLSRVDESSTKAGLPYLSQIPGIGALAGTQSSNKNNTDMLFVITADIIK